MKLSNGISGNPDQPENANPLPSLDEHQLYFFGLSGDAAELSFQAEKELKIRDLVEAAKTADAQGHTAIQVKYPVCLDCFEMIVLGMEQRIHKEEAERDIYMRELQKIEKKIKEAEAIDESALEAELRILEAEEQELDKQLANLEEEDKSNQNELMRLEGTKASL